MLVTNERIKAPVNLLRQLPIVGSKWNGKPQSFIDTQSGVFWQVMPKLSDNELQIQRALLTNKFVVSRCTVLESFILSNGGSVNVEQSKATDEVAPRPTAGFTAGAIAKTGSSD